MSDIQIFESQKLVFEFVSDIQIFELDIQSELEFWIGCPKIWIGFSNHHIVLFNPSLGLRNRW